MDISEKSNFAVRRGGTLAELRPGERGVVDRMKVDAALRHRLNALGLVKGVKIGLEHTAPMGDPRAYCLLGYLLILRNEDARKIILWPGIEPDHDADRRQDPVSLDGREPS